MSAHRYVVIGAGAIGGTIGGVLARAGLDVLLIARGAHARALAERGLTLTTPDGVYEVPVEVCTSPTDVRLTTRDVLVFATKTHQLATALHDWVDRPVHHDGVVVGSAGAVLPVLTALNGVAAETMASRFFARVFGVSVWMPAGHLDPGEVIVRSWPVAGQFHIARCPASAASGEDAALLDEIAESWTVAGIRIQLPADVMPWKYNKLLSNLANAVVALTGSGEETADLVAAIRSEGQRVLTDAGIAFTSFEESTAARAAHGPAARPVPGVERDIPNSTWQSLVRNSGSVETDYLNGEIVKIAHRHGSTAPLNAALARLAREAAVSGRRPGEYSAAQLAELLGIGQQESR